MLYRDRGSKSREAKEAKESKESKESKDSKEEPSTVDGDPQAHPPNLIGVKVIAPGNNPTVDIIFVHGLEGNPYKTWTYKEKGKPDIYWPKELLAQELPEARILAYGYDTSLTAFFDKASTNMIHHHAMTLVTRLQLFRARKINGQNSTERPIIWVAHSLGGILVKRALIYSQSCGVGHNEKLRSIIVSTQAIAFMGTPHMGSSLAAWGATAHKIAALMPGGDKNNTLPKTLEADSETLQNITVLFAGISQQFDIIFFYEELKTSILGKQVMVVEHTSAVMTALPNTQQVGIHATHQGMCKYKDENSPGYSDLAGILREFIENAEKFTPNRWRAEKQRSVLATNEEIDRKWLGSGVDPHILRSLADSSPLSYGGSTYGNSSRDPSPGPAMLDGRRSQPKLLAPHEHDPNMCIPPSVPAFVVPYTQNQSPVRRHHCLVHIDKTLQNKELLENGHTSLLLWGAPGSGKTHLIREYVFTRRGRFSGGIFWVKAKNKEDRNSHFRKICQELKLTKDDIDEDDEQEIGGRRLILAAFGGNESSVEKVVNWLKKRTNWLLVIDGANVDSEEEINDLKELIPAGAGGSIIFTSLNKNLNNYARLGPPVSYEIPKMTLDEGMTLLLSEAGLNDPTREEYEVAKNLVQMMEHLPLAIHLAANYIAESAVSIHAYYREYKEHPKVSGPGWTSTLGMTIKTLKGKHREAANLLNLISFFGGDIPVELVKWGIEILPKGVRIIAREEDGTRDFHLTVKHLLSFSLVRRSNEKETGPGDREWRVDRLHMQTVVQTFCRLQLGDVEGRLWGTHAINVFCHAFDLAEKVRGEDGPLFVKDYDIFLLHGDFLLKYTQPLHISRKSLRDRLKKAKAAINAQIKKQDEAEENNEDIPLPRRSIFGRGDSESPLTNFNSRTSTFGSTSSNHTTSDEHEPLSNDSSSLNSSGKGHSHADDSLSSEAGGSSRGGFAEPSQWTEVKRRKPARTFSTGSASSSNNFRGQYSRQRYPRKNTGQWYGSNNGWTDRRRSNQEYPREQGHDRSQSTGPGMSTRSYPGRGRGMARYGDTPPPFQPSGGRQSGSHRGSRDRSSPGRANRSSVVGPRDPSPQHLPPGPEYQAPPRANISDRLSPARGRLYSDVARGDREGRRSRGQSRHSSHESSRRGGQTRDEVGPESMSRDSSRSTQSFVTVMPAVEMGRSASHPYSEPPRPPGEWSPPQHVLGRGSGSGSRRGSIESARGRSGNPGSRRASPMDPHRVPRNWQDIQPPPPLPVEPAYSAPEMARLASAPAATYAGMGSMSYAEYQASAEMPVAPPLFPMGELTVGESYLPRSSAAYALARGQVPVQVPIHPLSVRSGPPGIFIPLAQTTSMPGTYITRSAPTSETSAFPTRVQHIPPHPEQLNPGLHPSNAASIRRAHSPLREERRGSLPEITHGVGALGLSDPSGIPEWNVSTAQIAASEPDLGRRSLNSSPRPAIVRTLATQTSDFAAMGSQFEGDEVGQPQLPGVPTATLEMNTSPPQTTTSSTRGSPRLPAYQPKLATVLTGLSTASTGASSNISKKSEESTMDRFSKGVAMAWKSATETRKKILGDTSSSKGDEGSKKCSPNGKMKPEKK